MFQQAKAVDGLHRPYIYDYYNVDYNWKSLSSGIHSPIGRIVNSLIDAINGNATLPRFIVFTPDVDVLRAMAYYQFGASLVISKGLSYLINEVDSIIATRKAELKKCRTGSVVHGEPKFVWIALLDKPYTDKVLSLRRKHNEILEETLTLHKNHFIVDPAVAMNRFDYDRSNHLTSSGKINFWKFVDRKLEELDADDSKFRPNKVISNMNCRTDAPLPDKPARPSSARRLVY